MNRKLRMFALFAIFSSLLAHSKIRADDEPPDPDTVVSYSKLRKVGLRNLKASCRILRPEAADGAAFDTGVTLPRWLDQNDQFLDERDPYPPGQDPFRERPGIGIGWFAGLDLNVVQPQILSQVNNTLLGPHDLFTGTFTNSTQLPFGRGGKRQRRGDTQLDW